MLEYLLSAIAVLGAVLYVAAGNHMGGRLRKDPSPLRGPALSSTDKKAVREAVLYGSASLDNSDLQLIATAWAAHEERLRPTTLRWRPVQVTGLILALSVLYLFKELLILTLVIQLLVLGFLALGTAVEWRGLRRCRTWTIRFGAPPADIKAE